MPFAAHTPPAAAAILAAVLALAVTLTVLPPFGHSLAAFAVVLWSAVPGVVLARALYRAGPDRRAAWLVGPMWGYALSCIVVLGLWVAGMRGSVLLIAPLIALVALVPLGRWLRGALASPVLGRGDAVAVCLLLVLLCALLARPFSRVGETLPDGSRAYRAYFTADFVWRMAVVAELAKGDVPPKNPFYRGDPLRYYWAAHVPAAAEYAVTKGRYRLESLLLANSVAVDVLFVLFLYAFVRQWTASAAITAIVCAALFLASSFEGTERLLQIHRDGAPLDAVRTLNIDAVTRWFYGSLPVDGLQRVMWYQPQHATAYALGLSVVLICAQAVRPFRVGLSLLGGILLAAAVLFSSFTALMITVMVALVMGWLVLRDHGWKWLLPAAVAGAVPLAAAAATTMALKYVDDQQGEVVRLMLNPAAVYNVWIALFLSFGPFLILSVVAAVLAVRRRESSLWPVAIVIAVSFAFYFFVDVVDHQFVYVGWRAGHLLFVAFGALCGYLLVEAGRFAPRARTAIHAVTLVLALAALPTVVIDAYNTQDTSNRMEAAIGRWTLVLEPDELAAFEWIRQYTPPSAIVQVDPQPRDPFTWSYIPAFAERRMAGGIPISMIPLIKYQRISRRIAEVFAAPAPESLYEGAASHRIDYLWVGTPERETHPELEETLESRPDLFRRVFQQGTVSIYYLERGPR